MAALEVTMPTYLRPGVYLEELVASQGPASAQRMLPPALSDRDRLTRAWLPEHTHAAFVGLASYGPFDKPVWLDSWQRFEATFGEPYTFDAGELSALAAAVRGFFANGGRSCVMVRVSQTIGSLVDAYVGGYDPKAGISALEAVDDVSLVCAPDLWLLRDQGLMSMDEVRTVQLGLIAHCELMSDRLAILDPPPQLTPPQVREFRADYAGYDTSFGVLYYPWLRAFDSSRLTEVLVPPCGHVAGVHARTDALRGFHHAAGNQPLTEVTGLERTLLSSEMDLLNPNGINAILPSVGRGSLVWGNRTLSSDPDRRYIHQRRVMTFVLRNLRRATEWAIFERIDDETLRPRLEADISEFLMLLWRSGTLRGHTPEGAFWVGADPTNYEDGSIRVTCEIALEEDRVSAFSLVYKLG